MVREISELEKSRTIVDQRAHFKQRVWERHGIIVDDDDIDELSSLIGQGGSVGVRFKTVKVWAPTKGDLLPRRATFVKRISRNKTLWLVRCDDVELLVLYNRCTKQPATCYEPRVTISFTHNKEKSNGIR